MDENLKEEINKLIELAIRKDGIKVLIEEGKITDKQLTEGEINKYLKGQFERIHEKLKDKLNREENPENKKEIIKMMNSVLEAYRIVSTPKKRMEFAELNANAENAYKYLGIDKEGLKNRDENDYIRGKFEKKIKEIKDKINATISKEEEEVLKIKLEEIENNYKKISTAENRKNYDLKLAYDRSEQADYGVIAEKDGKKQIHKQPMESPIYNLQNENGENIKVRLIGEVHYKNNLGIEDDYINQFAVKKTIDGEENTYIIYTNSLVLAELEVDKETGEPKNPEYYTTVANELLSNDTLEASTKYTGGYVGEIENNKLCIKDEKLDDTQKERLGVILSYKEMTEKDKTKEDDGEER